MPKKLNFLGAMQNYDPKTGEYKPTLKGPNGESPASFAKFKKNDEKKEEKVQKPKGINEYTDELFEKLNLKTFTSKKYKNKEGDIVEIRRFGEGKHAIRYNETKDIVEQVWLNGEKIN